MSDQSIGVHFAWLVAASEAIYGRYAFIEPPHLFIGLCSLEKILESEELQKLQDAGHLRLALESDWNLITGCFQPLGLDPTVLRRQLRVRLNDEGVDHPEGAVIHRSTLSRQVFTRAMDSALNRGLSVLGVMDLLVALLDEEIVIEQLRDKGVNIPILRRQAAKAQNPEAGDKKPSTIQGGSHEEQASFLSRYTRDLTRLATEGRFHPPIGRREQMLQLVRTLARESKNNPVLIGDAWGG